ncbi:hypothetical protein [Nitrosopumilus sp.]|uniref:hypothetical protein n=1 Tax=Nitrosopumilus sp. TaxID=2024843 RepID=UPI003D12847C
MPEFGNFTNFVTKGVETEEKDDRRIIKGHITVEVVDKQDEFVAVSEVTDVIKSYFDVFPAINDWHSNRMVGKALSYKKSEIDGHPSVYIEAEIFKKKGVELYDNVWDKIVKGEYAGFSMGGASKVREPIVKGGKLVMNLKALELYEISVCPMPINQLAVIDYVNEFAKASNLGVMENGGKQRIQCSGVNCEFEKAEVEKKEIEKSDGNISDSEKDNNLYIDKSETNINNMTNDNSDKPIEKSENSTNSVDHSSEISLLSTLVKGHENKLDSIESVLKGINEKLEKAEDANPVEHGATKEEKPAVTDSSDVGAKTEAAPDEAKTYAPTGDAQGGTSDTVKDQKPDDAVAKAEDDKKEDEKDDKKDDVAKSEDKKDDKDEKKDMEKAITGEAKSDGFEYTVLKAVRPKGIYPETPKGAPTGAQVLDAINKGWGGKHTNYEQSFIEGWNRLLKGELGTGLPQGGF